MFRLLGPVFHANSSLMKWRNPVLLGFWCVCQLVALARESQGIVLDEHGDPVRGAQIYNAIELGDVPPSFHRPGQHLLGASDSVGRWSLTNAPERLSFSHPDFARETVAATTTVVLLRRGVTVRGIVVDKSGRAIEGVRILGGDFPVWTPVDGRFVLSNCRPGALALVAQRSGYAAGAELVQVTAAGAELEWTLPAALPRRLRVRDAEMRPVPDADVIVERRSAPVPWDWRWRTDAEGIVLWSGAPTGEVRFAVMKGNFRPLPGVRLAAGQADCDVVLHRLRAVNGSVRDEAGAPVGDFELVAGAAHGDSVAWDDQRPLKGSAGSFFLPLPGEAAAFVRVSAAGFETVVSRRIEPDEESVSLEFTLHKAEHFAGRVRDEDNRPVAGAEVVVLGPGERVVLERGSFAVGLPTRRAVTDAAGRFRIETPRDAISLLAAQPGVGFGEAAFAAAQKSGNLILRPWGRIEGRLEFTGRPVTNQLVAIGPLGMTNLWFHRNAYTALTDADGRFRFEIVPPGLHNVGRVVRGFLSHTIAVKLEPGRTREIKLGGAGTRVIGRLRVPGAEPPPEDTGAPAGLRQRRRDGSVAAYEFEFGEAGAFVVEAVPPGDYELEAHWHEMNPQGDGEICHGAWRTNVNIAAKGEVDLGELFWQKPAAPADGGRKP
jgi:hypothetical protein